MKILIWDKMIEGKILTMCCVCKKIKINDEFDLWLKREDNSVLYNRFINKFGERVSDGYCPEDLEKAMEEVKQYKLDKKK